MGGLGMWELLVILMIVVVIFGASRLPQLGKGLGEGIRNFKQSLKRRRRRGGGGEYRIETYPSHRPMARTAAPSLSESEFFGLFHTNHIG